MFAPAIIPYRLSVRGDRALEIQSHHKKALKKKRPITVHAGKRTPKVVRATVPNSSPA